MLLSTFFEEVDSFINLYQIISKLKSSVTREWTDTRFSKKNLFLCKSFMHYIFFFSP